MWLIFFFYFLDLSSVFVLISYRVVVRFENFVESWERAPDDGVDNVGLIVVELMLMLQVVVVVMDRILVPIDGTEVKVAISCMQAIYS